MNGSGKTTLLDILAGDSDPDTGNVSRKRYTTIGYLRQETDLGSDRTLLEEVLEESPEIVNVRDKIATAYKSFESLSVNNGAVDHSELLQEITMLEASLEAVDGIRSEHKGKAILSGLGFKQSDFSRPVREFSGGWLMRAALGKLLLSDPDVLLLDEPTNHLDLEANLWFEKYLSGFRGCVVVTSHDRAFLNQSKVV